MSFRLILSAVAVLALSAPAFAQTVPAPPAAPAAASDAVSPAGPSEEEMSAAGDAFGDDMDAMQAELTAAKAAAGADTAKANVDADAIQAKYQAKADAFGVVFKAFVDANPGAIPPEAMTVITTQIATAPAQVRQGVMAAPAAASEPAPAQ